LLQCVQRLFGQWGIRIESKASVGIILFARFRNARRKTGVIRGKQEKI
jgi:hypothetical protein